MGKDERINLRRKVVSYDQVVGGYAEASIVYVEGTPNDSMTINGAGISQKHA